MEARKIAEIDAKIAARKLDLQVLRVQLTLQRQQVELLTKLISLAKGVEVKADLTEFDEAIKTIDNEIKALSDKQTELKVETDVDTKPVEDFERDVEGNPIVAPLDVDPEPAFTGYKVTKDYIEKDEIVSPLDLDTAPAEQSNSQLLKLLAQPIPDRYVHTYEVFHPAQRTQNKAEGGLIQKLATGGSAGFPRRSGKIAGHDLSGSDNVRTMLTQGEFVNNVRSVDYYGQGLFDALNARAIPKADLHLATGGAVDTSASSTQSTGRPINLTLGNETFKTMADSEVAEALERYTRKNL